jgi:hypothetical protein
MGILSIIVDPPLAKPLSYKHPVVCCRWRSEHQSRSEVGKQVTNRMVNLFLFANAGVNICNKEQFPFFVLF